ncbi:hypothetical protein Tco_0638046 [Tanacetum coccineum]
MEDEEVHLVNGVFEGALGALALEMEALVDAMEDFPKSVRAFWVRIAEARILEHGGEEEEDKTKDETCLVAQASNEERISHKRTKNQSKRDKTGHGMEKCVETKPNQSKVYSEKKKQRKI